MAATEKFYVTNDLLATQGQRFLHNIVDTIVIYLLIIIASMVFAIIASLLGTTDFVEKIETIDTLEGYLIFFSIMLPYFIILETYTSRTIAKYITRTIVVNHDGSKPKLIQIFKRTLCRIIPFDGISFLGSVGRGWHDTIPNVYVVKKEAFERSKELFYSFEEIGKPQIES